MYRTGYFQFFGTEPVRYGLSLVAAPALEPVTLAEQKTFSRVDISTDDTLISSLIQAAREYCEDFTGRRFYTQTWDLKLDYFFRNCGQMRMPNGPWQSITSITYVDINGTTQTVSTSIYDIDTSDFEPRLFLKFGQYWPVERQIQNAVTIRHVAGYGTAASIPERLKLAIKLLAGYYYEQRSAGDAMKLSEAPFGVNRILSQLKQSWI